MSDYYVEGEIKEIHFTQDEVSFVLAPSTEFKLKEGDREFVTLLSADETNDMGSAILILIEKFMDWHFKCVCPSLCNQFVTIMTNRCKVRVCFCIKTIRKIEVVPIVKCVVCK